MEQAGDNSQHANQRFADQIAQSRMNAPSVSLSPAILGVVLKATSRVGSRKWRPTLNGSQTEWK